MATIIDKGDHFTVEYNWEEDITTELIGDWIEQLQANKTPKISPSQILDLLCELYEKRLGRIQ